jgi:putative ABC transport system substrate-binding protein
MSAPQYPLRLNRRRFVQGAGLAGLGLVAGCGRLPGQAPAKVPRLGFLGSSSADRNQARLVAFRDALRELGYVDGQSIIIEYRYAGGEFERLPDLARELLRLQPTVLLAEGAPAAHAAKNATSTVPIIMGNAADPVGTGLVASLARPGGNVTGLSDFNLGVVTKLLELLKDVAPAATVVALLMNPSNPTHPLQLKELRAAAPALGVTLLPLEAAAPDDIDGALATVEQARTGALIVLGDPMLASHASRVRELASQARLPAIYASRTNVDAGGLMSYGTNFEDLYRRAAVYLDKILKGAKPADLPVEQPRTFELVINLKAAQALGLTIPQHVLLQATEIIQ